MNRIIAVIAVTMIFSSLSGQENFYDFSVKSIDGGNFNFSTLKGKKVMVVNTASKCGLTPQYEELQSLWEEYGGEDFIIIGFPANNFLGQEPGSDSEIASFCSENYGVTFPMMSKISVKGKDIHPLYKWLTTASLNGVEDSEVSWNFQKYLIDEDGKLAKVVKPKVTPYDKEIVAWLKQ